MNNSQLTQKALDAFDKANSQDPNLELVNGIEIPKELIYGQRMTDTLKKFSPKASIPLQLAARCQHICRWESPRSNYEMNRKGYLTWRAELKKFHTKKASEILEELKFEDDIIERVSFLLQKKQLKRDEDTQTLEDVICLVFLEYYFEAFRVKHTEEKVIDIIQKTWKKMSQKGHNAALQITYSSESLSLIKKALS